MTNVILFGTGNISNCAHHYLKRDAEYTVVAFTDYKEFIQNDTHIDNLPVVEFENIKELYPPSEYKLFAPISARNLNKTREKVYQEGKQLGYEFISYISPLAILMTDKIGENCFILENNVLQYNVEIGDNCVLWSGNHIGHESKIGNSVFISSHVVVSGSCQIKDYCYIGVNTALRDGIIIEKNNVIGMSSAVTKSIDTEYGVYVGIPSQKIKDCDDSIVL